MNGTSKAAKIISSFFKPKKEDEEEAVETATGDEPEDREKKKLSLGARISQGIAKRIIK